MQRNGVCGTQPREGTRSKAETLPQKALLQLWEFKSQLAFLGRPSEYLLRYCLSYWISPEIFRYLNRPSEYLLRYSVIFMPVAVLCPYAGPHPQLKGHLSVWCLKEDSPTMAVPSSCFPHPLALMSVLRPFLNSLNKHPRLLCVAGHHQLVSGMLVLFVMTGSKQDSEKKLKKTLQKVVNFEMLLGAWFSHCSSFSPATETGG